MAYIHRHAEAALERMASMFGAVLVTGVRQVGKTTLLAQTRPDITRLSFDTLALAEAAANAPEVFFSYNRPPLILDEIQKAPSLFPEMKLAIDQAGAKGLFYLSSSQQFNLMEQVTESLAGRIGMLNLGGLTWREEHGVDFIRPFVPTPEYYAGRQQQPLPPVDPSQVWRRIHRGSMPELLLNGDYDRDMFYGSYVSTYIERDVRQLANIGDSLSFMAFMGVIAARTGQMLNMSDIASSVGISIKTAQRWLLVLQASNLVYLLRPYFDNRSKRAVKTPKLYFTDTGLAAYLAKWSTPEVLRDGAMAGAYFETFAVMEVVRSYQNAGYIDPPLYYYRDKDKREIDLLIESDGCLHPLEVKATGAPRPGDAKAFAVLDGLSSMRRGPGGVVCLGESLQPLSGQDAMIPLSYL